MSEAKITMKGIEHFFDSDWFEDKATSQIFMRAYVSVGVAFSEGLKVYSPATSELTLDVPIKISWVRLKNFNSFKIDHYYSVDENGDLGILTEEVDLDLPSANYAVFASPLVIDGGEEIERDKIRSAFDKAAALIRSYAGKNILYSIATEGGYSANTGVQVVADMTIERIPSILDGPVKESFIWPQIKEVLDTLGGTDEDNKNRLSLALEILHRAISEPKLSLFHYWTAIELVCDADSGPKIRSKISKCYNFSNQHDVDKKLGFTTLYKWRGDLVHKGLHKEIPVDIERYFQTLFLDLIRYELGLKNYEFAIKCLSSKHFNFNSIGLDDNRSTEQKERSDEDGLKIYSGMIKPALIQKRILGRK